MSDKFARILVSGRHVLCSGFRAATLTVIYLLLQAWAQQVPPPPADTTTMQALLERVEKLEARVQVLEAEKAAPFTGKIVSEEPPPQAAEPAEQSHVPINLGTPQ